MLTQMEPRFDDVVPAPPTIDWRCQAAREFGDDAVAPMAEQFLALLQAIYAASCRSDEQRSMSVQFLETENDPLTAELSKLFAAFAAERLGAPVCLMSFDAANRAKISNFGDFDAAYPMRGAPAAVLGETGHAGDRSALRTKVVDDDRDDHRPLARSEQGMELANEPWSAYLERERAKAALLIIHSRPLGESLESLMISRKVDGVILMIDAESGRAEAAKTIRDKITAVGGQLLGAILNKPPAAAPSYIEAVKPAFEGLIQFASRTSSDLSSRLASWCSYQLAPRLAALSTRWSWRQLGLIASLGLLVAICYYVIFSPTSERSDETTSRQQNWSRHVIADVLPPRLEAGGQVQLPKPSVEIVNGG